MPQVLAAAVLLALLAGAIPAPPPSVTALAPYEVVADGFGPAEAPRVPLHEGFAFCRNEQVLVEARVFLADLRLSTLDQEPVPLVLAAAREVEPDDHALTRQAVSAQRVAHRPERDERIEVLWSDLQPSGAPRAEGLADLEELVTRGCELVGAAAPSRLGRRSDDPELLAKTKPDYKIGCKRVLFTADWYPALRRENVNLITDGIERITAKGVLGKDGVEREVDTIIWGTGFRSHDFVAPMDVEGIGGRDLNDVWRERPEAYLGFVADLERVRRHAVEALASGHEAAAVAVRAALVEASVNSCARREDDNAPVGVEPMTRETPIADERRQARALIALGSAMTAGPARAEVLAWAEDATRRISEADFRGDAFLSLAEIVGGEARYAFAREALGGVDLPRSLEWRAWHLH